MLMLLLMLMLMSDRGQHSQWLWFAPMHRNVALDCFGFGPVLDAFWFRVTTVFLKKHILEPTNLSPTHRTLSVSNSLELSASTNAMDLNWRQCMPLVSRRALIFCDTVIWFPEILTKVLLLMRGNAVLGQRGDWGAVHVSLWAASIAPTIDPEGGGAGGVGGTGWGAGEDGGDWTRGGAGRGTFCIAAHPGPPCPLPTVHLHRFPAIQSFWQFVLFHAKLFNAEAFVPL